MRPDGVVDALPFCECAIDSCECDIARVGFIELLRVGFVGSFHKAI